MNKEIAVKGFSNYILKTSNEKDINAYELINIKTGKTRKVTSNPSAFYNLKKNNDKKSIHIPAKEFIWNYIPYFKNKKETIDSTYIPVFNYEDEYSIDLTTQKIWSKRNCRHMKYSFKKGIPSIRFNKDGHEKAFLLSHIVWKSYFQEEVDTLRNEIIHLDANIKNNDPINLMKFPISVASSIRGRYNYIRKCRIITSKKINETHDIICSYNIPEWKKRRLRLELDKLISKKIDII